MSVRFCRECGAEQGAPTAFCAQCGAALPGAAPAAGAGGLADETIIEGPAMPPPPPVLSAPPPPAPPPVEARSNRRGLFIAAGVVALVLLVGGAVLALGGGDDGNDDVATASTTNPPTTGTPPTDDPTTTEPTTTTESTTTTTTEPPEPVPVVPIGVSGASERPSVNLRCTGKRVDYAGPNLIDGNENTGWGTFEDDGTGQSITIDLGEPVALVEIGLTPGYTKVGPRSDAGCADVSAFERNRFVPRVSWRFDDGTSVEQTFDRRPELQFITVDTRTRFVVLTILATERPEGADDDTILSEAVFRRRP